MGTIAVACSICSRVYQRMYSKDVVLNSSLYHYVQRSIHHVSSCGAVINKCVELQDRDCSLAQKREDRCHRIYTMLFRRLNASSRIVVGISCIQTPLIHADIIKAGRSVQQLPLH